MTSDIHMQSNVTYSYTIPNLKVQNGNFYGLKPYNII